LAKATFCQYQVKLPQEREALFAVVDEVQANNRDLTLNDDELMAFVSEAVHTVLAHAQRGAVVRVPLCR
jgi:hypothetical protein